MLTDTIQKKLKQLPEAPGVYKMLDAEGKIIYVGKSKCLKKRVSSYFVPEPKWEKARKMSPFIRDMDFTVTDTHLEAMLLECRLIKQIRPYFNVIMKFDEKYVYLEVGADRRKSPLSVTYTKTDNSFGPVRSRRCLEELMEDMRNLYPLKKKEDGSIGFSYHVFPEVMSEEAFINNRRVLQEICENPSVMQKFVLEAEKQMQDAAEKQRFEMAMRYRNLADNLRYLNKGLHAWRELTGRDIVYTVALEEGYKMFYIRGGLVIYAQKTSEDGKQRRNRFVKEAEKITGHSQPQISEKESVDYRSIVYAELSEADEKNITYI